MQTHIGGWSHILRQPGADMRAQFFRSDCVSVGPPCCRDVVGYQLLVTGRDFGCDDQRLTHIRMFGQPGLDLSQFNAEAANLDLKIVAA